MIDIYKSVENLFKKIQTHKNYFLIFVAVFLCLELGIFLLDTGLAVGLSMDVFLTAMTFLIIYKLGIRDRKVYILFLIVLFVHFCVVLGLYITKLQPFGGGADFEGYHQNAVAVAQRFSHGNFSLEGLYSHHYFPVVIGIVYMFTLPKMIVGQLFVVFLAALSALFLYFLIIEIGGSKTSAFLAGLLMAIYPSYLYFGDLLLKDTVMMPLTLLGLLVAVNMLKNFDGFKFVIFFATLTALIHFRFYIGFALMFSFIICWFLLSNLKAQDRIIYGFTIVFLLGFSPLLLGYGYYGSTPLQSYLTQDVITKYREVVYAPTPDKPVNDSLATTAGTTHPAANTNNINTTPTPKPQPAQGKDENSGVGSSFVVSAGFDSPVNFTKNYLQSFTYSILGPLPWQLRYKRHLLFLIETIPWYFLILITIYSGFKKIKENGVKRFVGNYRFAIPLILFSIMAFAALSLYINNFGIIVRIRMPMYVVLLAVMALLFDYSLNNIGFIKKWINI